MNDITPIAPFGHVLMSGFEPNAMAPRILAFDVGSKRIGVAVSDALGIIATGAGVITRRGIEADVAEIGRLAALYQVEKIVVGYPINLKGSFGPQAQAIDRFAARLRSAGLSVELEDERFTTKIAERVLIAADVSRWKRKAIIDQQAAILILQGYLDRTLRRARGFPGQGEAEGS